MRLTHEWVCEYVETVASPQEIADTLTMLGHEVEAIEQSDLGAVLAVKVTPNRGDCLSVLGIARELAASDPTRFQPTELMREAIRGWTLGDEATPLSATSVTIETPDLCPRYAARVWNEAPMQASADWMQARLVACGMRPINVIVDTTNYVMLELGQPLHAFDLDLLREERIVVRTARPGEKMRTLDGIEREFSTEMMLICDAERPVAVAGVMGGEETEVTQTTKRILLESAHFQPASVRRTRRALNLPTEASHRFERHVDPEGVVRALNRFALLLSQQTGVAQEPGVCDLYPGRSELQPVQVREARWNLLLGMEVPRAAAAASLNSIGMRVAETEEGLTATPPSWRADIAIEEDLVEEIGRLAGYENMPERLPEGSTPQGGESALTSLRTRARDAMLRLGFIEVVTHSLRAPSPLDAPCDPIRLRNPASPEVSVLRNSLLPGLADAARRQHDDSFFLFEVGRVFLPEAERVCIAGLMRGQLLPEHWRSGHAAEVDVFTLKGALQEVGARLHRLPAFEQSNDERFHPAKQARVVVAGQDVGVMGELSRLLVERMHLQPSLFAFEMDLTSLLELPEATPRYKPFSAFPHVRRDIAIEVPKDVPYAQIERLIRESAAGLLEEVWLFDVYEGKGIEEGKHSLGIAMTLRHMEKTLTDEEANEVRERVLQALASLGAKQR